MKRILAAAAAAVLAVAGLTAVATAATAAPSAHPATAKPAPTKAELEAYEREMRANGTEARVMAEGNRAAKLANRGVKGFPRVPGKSAGAGGSAMLTPCAAPCYHYNGFVQDLTSDPATAAAMATMTGKPYVDNGTYAATHSLGELAVQSGDLGDIVEIGWTVDKTLRADGNPILFASHWINGLWWGYNAQFVDYAPNAVNLGAGLPKPVVKGFEIAQTSTAHWVYYDGQPVAYVPKSRWTPGGVAQPFNAATADYVWIQAFSEIAADETDPCTDMGTGTLWNAGGSPTPPVTSWSAYNLGGTAISPSWTVLSGSPGITGVWGANASSGTTGETGGSGYTSGGGTPGSTGSC
jgi:hypothetical protein